MLIKHQIKQPKQNLVIDVEEEEVNNMLSELADIAIDDYLNHITTRCYTKIKSISKNDYEQSSNSH